MEVDVDTSHFVNQLSYLLGIPLTNIDLFEAFLLAYLQCMSFEERVQEAKLREAPAKTVLPNDASAVCWIIMLPLYCMLLIFEMCR